jgi:hypothetical protein
MGNHGTSPVKKEREYMNSNSHFQWIEGTPRGAPTIRREASVRNHLKKFR